MSKAVVIQYIGTIEPHTSPFGMFVFAKKGDTATVDSTNAAKMMEHPSVYKLDEAKPEGKTKASKAKAADEPANEGESTTESAEVEQAAEAQRQADEEAARKAADALQEIGMMETEALADYAKTHFNVKLDKRVAVETLRSQVQNLFNQFGANP